MSSWLLSLLPSSVLVFQRAQLLLSACKGATEKKKEKCLLRKGGEAFDQAAHRGGVVILPGAAQGQIWH